MKNVLKQRCCGCGACSNICPAQTVTMERNEDGFASPNTTGCINCELYAVLINTEQSLGPQRMFSATITAGLFLKKGSPQGPFTGYCGSKRSRLNTENTAALGK